jgi:hypothetical protein
MNAQVFFSRLVQRMHLSDRPWRPMAWLRRSPLVRLVFSLIVALGCITWLNTPAALAGLTDDHYDGNIFALYAGNGSLVPPRVTLPESRQRNRAALLVFYLDDSSDCKQFAPLVSQLDAFYGRAADFIPISVDTIAQQRHNDPLDPGYYYNGRVPQTVLLDQSGKVVLNETGQVAFERVDDVFREVFDLLPRSESAELQRRPVNEINTELTP